VTRRFRLEECKEAFDAIRERETVKVLFEL
jgi:hypothetical protein